MNLDSDDDHQQQQQQQHTQPLETSFVKRSRPRGAGLRTKSSAFSGDPSSTAATAADKSAEASTSSVPASTSGNAAATSIPPARRRVGAISLDLDNDDDTASRPQPGTSTPAARRDAPAADDEDLASSSVVFRSRNRAANRIGGGSTTASTSSSSSLSRTAAAAAVATTSGRKKISFAALDGEEQAEDQQGSEPGFEIRRSQLASRGKEARKKEREGVKQRLVAPNTLSLDQASITAEPPDANGATPTSQASYSSSYLAELKASTPSLSSRPGGSAAFTNFEVRDPMAMQIDDDGADAAPRDYDDADDDQSLARTKFSADFAHDGIPSESVIRAAKEKRARMRKELLERNGGGFGAGDDFISLGGGGKASSSRAMRLFGEASSKASGDDYQGPHPESRLQREEDEYGDGEEEYAEYTGATERIPIGKKAEQEYKLQQRREMQEALTDGRSDYAGLADDHEVDEDEEEWERAQLRRTEMPGIKQKQQEHREKSPYRPAEIPLTAPLPTMTSASARLARKMRELEESAEAHATVVEDADKGLEALLQGEKENKEEVVEAEEKESWFRELEQFVTSLAGFMEAKAPRIDDVERDYVDMLVERTRLVQRARAKRMEDELALFWGVPSSSVLPPLPKTGEPDDQQRQQQQQTEQQQTDDLQLEPSPMEDGDFNSAVRLQRQSDAALMAQVDADELSASDAAAFEVAWRALSDRLSSALSDVKAPEYLDVAARLPASSPSSEPSLHPRSVVSRFSEWRRRYPLEYAQAWGGLAIASIWEFYARLEMALSDPLLPSSSSSSSKGGAGLEHYRWHREAIVYAEPSHHDDDDVAAPEGEAAGGDDEILLTIVQNVVLPRLTTLAERAAYDPWDKKQTQAVLRGVQEASYVVDKAGVRFQTLITSYLGLFRQHTTALVESMAGPPGLAAPSIHPSTPAALTGFVRRLITTLLTNLVSWSRHVSPGWHGARTELLGLIDDLLGRVLWPLVVRAKGFGVGGAEAAQRVLELVPHHLVSPDVWARWKALVDNAPL